VVESPAVPGHFADFVTSVLDALHTHDFHGSSPKPYFYFCTKDCYMEVLCAKPPEVWGLKTGKFHGTCILDVDVCYMCCAMGASPVTTRSTYNAHTL